MIVKAEDLDFTNKKLSILIYGVPSIGKTTLGLSAPRPLLIDLDKGVSRVESKFRKDTLECKTYEEMMTDLSNEDLSCYESIIIDTAGALLELEKAYVIKQDPKNAKRNGQLSLAGYGAIANEFKHFTEFVKSLDKHIIYIFHADEQRDDDNVCYRLSAEGSTKTKVWESIDLGGFMEVIGKERTINFSANSRFFAKGNNEINGSYKIPILKDDVKNDFLTKLINHYITALNKNNEKINAEKEIYKRAMEFKKIIDSAQSEEAINDAYENLKKLKHALTSKKELFNALVNQAKNFNLKFDRKENKFNAVKS